MKTAAISIRGLSHPRYKFRVSFSQGGAYEQRYFKTKKEAKGFASDKKVELLNEGRKHGEWTDEERRAVIESREVGEELASKGIKMFSVREAVSFYAEHLRHLKKSATVDKALNELIDVRQAEGKSDGHVRDLQYKLRKFTEHFTGRLVASFTTTEIAAWLLGLKCQPQTRLNYKRLLHNLFAFSVGRGYAPSNPVAGALKIKVPAKGEIGILKVIEATKLLAVCPPEILPAVAIGLFAGLRREEIARLDWQEVNLDRGFIEVKASKAKTAQRRIVEMSRNLRTWLRPHLALDGAVRPSEAIFRERLSEASKTAGIAQWPHNALRHSFASFHLAMHEDAAKTALMLGHTESTTLFKHYRELVRREDAVKFWKIAPTKGKPKKRKPTLRKPPEPKPSNVVFMQEAAA
jgi:integrase